MSDCMISLLEDTVSLLVMDSWARVDPDDSKFGEGGGG